MSFSQSRSDMSSESQYRKSGNRSGNASASYQRTNSAKSSAGGGGRSFKKPNNVQGEQSRESAQSVTPELNYVAAPPRKVQNGVHQQVSSQGMSDATKESSRTNSSPTAPSSNPAVPKSSQPVSVQTPPKTDVGPPKGFSLQFGSISHGFLNGIQAQRGFSRTAPAAQLPSIPKQLLPVKEPNVVEHPVVALPNLKKETQMSSPASSSTLKPSALPAGEMPMQIPFHQTQGPVQFGVPLPPQFQPQGVPSTSLQMPAILPKGNSPLVQQPIFVSPIQPHPMQHHGIMHQGQGINFCQFIPPQPGKFSSLCRAVNITHPDTREELRLDQRGETKAGEPPKSGIQNTVPQPQSVLSFISPHPFNYYSSSISSPVYYPPTISSPLGTQIAPILQTASAHYPIKQGPKSTVSLSPSASNNVNSAHGHAELLDLEMTRNIPTSIPSTNPFKREGVSSKLDSITANVANVVNQSGSSNVKSLDGTNAATTSATISVKSSTLTQPTLAFGVYTSNEGSKKESMGRSNLINDQQKKPTHKEHHQSQPQGGGKATSTVTTSLPLNDGSSRITDGTTTIALSGSTKLVSSASSVNPVTRDASGSPKLTIPAHTLSEESKKQVQSIQNKAMEQASAELKEGTKEDVRSKENSSLTAKVERGEAQKSSTETMKVGYSTPAVAGLVPSAVCTKKSDTSDESNPPKAVLESKGTASLEEVTTYPIDPKNTHKAGSNDVVPLGLNRPKSATAKGKKKIKEVLQKADAAGTTSDLYIAYKGPREKGSTLSTVIAESESCSVDVKQVPADTKEDIERLFEQVKAVNIDKASFSSRDQRADFGYGNNMGGFRPGSGGNSGVLRYPHGQVTGQHSGGILSGPLQPLNSFHRENPDGDSWQRPTISSPQTPAQMMHKAEKKYEVGNLADEEQAEQRQLNGILNKLTPQNFERLFEQVKAVNIDNSVTITGVISQIFDKALMEPTFCEMYADFCFHLAGELPDFAEGNEKITLKRVLLNKCQEEYERGEREQEEANNVEQEGEVAQSKEEREEKRVQARRRMLGNIRLIGELYKKRMLTERIMHECIKKLLGQYQNTEEEDIEGLCKLMSTIGEMIDHPKAKEHMKLDRDSCPSLGRGSAPDRSTGAARSERREYLPMNDDKWSKGNASFSSRDQRDDLGYGNNMGGFRPGSGGNSGVLRYPHGQVARQHYGGILSGPLQPLNSFHRENPDGDRWQRPTNSSPQTPAQMMHKAEKKYEVGKVADEEQAKQRQLKGILNKLTPQNFERLFKQVKAVNIDNAVTLTGIISQIFDRALMEPIFCEMYADFCFHLAGELPDFTEGNEKITFKRVLLNKCQEEFERGERVQEEANKVEQEGEVAQSKEEREEKRVQARRRMLGNIRLIGELYKKRMLTERIMHECIKKLLGQYQNTEEDIEALCILMSTIGEYPIAKKFMDAYFDMMLALSNNMKYSSRVRFMLKDSIDLRENKWQQRQKVEGPKKIEEVHRDAAHERQAQSSRLTRGPSMNASIRRGMLTDFDPRGSSILASQNSQTGKVRKFPSQVRGFGGTQDVRMEGRQPSNESRNVSVLLPQRIAGNDTLTLGPQGGLARGMSMRGATARLNGYGTANDRSAYSSNENALPRSASGRLVVSANNQPAELDRNLSLENEMRSSGRHTDRPTTTDEKEVVLCIKDLNTPSFYPSMVALWVTDSLERKDMERNLLSTLLVSLAKAQDNSLTCNDLIKGFKTVLTALEDAVNDAPRAPEFLGRLFATVVLENVIPLGDIGQIIHKGGEEPGSLVESGLAGDVIGNILEVIQSTHGDSYLNETLSSLRLEDFRPPHPLKSRKLDKFL